MTLSTRAALNLSASQKRHLQLLLTSAAVDVVSGASAYTLSSLAAGDGVSSGTLSKLWRAGLTDSRVKSLGRGSQMTVYWLTDAGYAIARDLAAVRRAA